MQASNLCSAAVFVTVRQEKALQTDGPTVGRNFLQKSWLTTKFFFSSATRETAPWACKPLLSEDFASGTKFGLIYITVIEIIMIADGQD